MSSEDTLKLLRQGFKEEIEGTFGYHDILRYDLPENVSKTLAIIAKGEMQHARGFGVLVMRLMGMVSPEMLPEPIGDQIALLEEVGPKRRISIKRLMQTLRRFLKHELDAVNTYSQILAKSNIADQRVREQIQAMIDGSKAHANLLRELLNK